MVPRVEKVEELEDLVYQAVAETVEDLADLAREATDRFEAGEPPYNLLSIQLTDVLSEGKALYFATLQFKRSKVVAPEE